MKEAVTKVIDTLTQENFHGAFQKLLERYNKCIATGRDYFEGGLEFHVCTINKSAHTVKSLVTYLMILVYITSYIYPQEIYKYILVYISSRNDKIIYISYYFPKTLRDLAAVPK